MNWTVEVPTTVGWYWCRRKGDPESLTIYLIEPSWSPTYNRIMHVYAGHGSGDDVSDILKWKDMEYAGPLEPPP